MRRISVIGTSGSGKTTFARRLAERAKLPHVELDALFWGPNWTPADDTLFRERVTTALSGDAWVCDGNYSSVRPMVLARADTVIWLDLPLLVCLWHRADTLVTPPPVGPLPDEEPNCEDLDQRFVGRLA